MDSKIVFLSGIFDDKLNGQLVTLRAVDKALSAQYRVVKLDRSLYGLLSVLKMLPIGFFNFNKVCCCYLFLHRSRIGFYFRDLPVFLVSNLMRVKIISHVVGNDLEFFLSSLTAFERKYVLNVFRNVTCWVVLGRVMEGQVRRVISTSQSMIHPKVVLVPGFYEPSFVYPSQPDFHEREFSLCFMSNFIRSKGVLDFLNALTILEGLDHQISLNCWLAGQQIHEDSGVTLALKEASLRPHIKILPPVTGLKKWELLRATKVFVLPTYYKSEYLPLSLVDAMLCGCICISTDTGEISSLLSSGRGFLTVRRDPEALAHRILEVLSDPNGMAIVSRNASTYIKSNFSFDDFCLSIVRAVKEA